MANSDLRFLRQLEAVNMGLLSQLKVTIIGAGSIGSCVALWLGKMGVGSITIYDNDSVEQHNWSNQMYRISDIGKLKVVALQEVMELFGGANPIVNPVIYEGQPLTEVVISAVDSMSSRKAIWESVRKDTNVRLYLDTRMGLETLMVHTACPANRDHRIRYSQTLYSDRTALQEPCTARTICYTPLMATCVVCNLVKRYVNSEPLPDRVLLDLATWTMMA